MRISDWSSDVCSSDLDTSVWVEKAQLRITSWHGPSRPSWNRRATTSLSPAGRSPSGKWVPPIGVTPAADHVIDSTSAPNASPGPSFETRQPTVTRQIGRATVLTHVTNANLVGRPPPYTHKLTS